MKDQKKNNLASQIKILSSSFFKWRYWQLKALFVMMFLLTTNLSIAALNLAVEVTPSNPSPNEMVTVRLVVTNPTGSLANNVRIELPYPANLFNLSDNALSNGGDCTTITDSTRCNSGETVFWDLGNLASGERRIVFLTPFIDSSSVDGTIITFAGKAFENGALQVSSSQNIDVTTNKVFNVLINAYKDPVAPASTLSYDLIYGHQGTTATTNTELRFPLPTGTSFVSADGNGVLSGNDVVWDLGLMNSGENGRHRVTVQLGAGVSSGDIIIAENATVTGEANFIIEQAKARTVTWVGSVPQLGFSMIVNPDPGLSGHYFPIQLKVVNRTNALLTGVRVELIFPDGLSSLNDGGLLDSGDCTTITDSTRCNRGETVFWNLGSLSAGVSKTVSISPNISSNTAGRLIPFMARALSDNSSDIWSTDTISIITNQTLGLLINANKDPVAPGSTLSYDLSYGHQGGTATTNTELRFPLPSGTSFVSADGNGILSGNEVIWNLGLVNPGEQGIHRVTVQLGIGVTAGDILIVENATISGEANFITEQARSRIATWVGSVPQLGFSMIVNPDPGLSGQYFPIQLKVVNRTNALLTGVRVELIFPDGLSSLNDGGLLDGGDCTTITDSTRCNSGETVFWNLGSLGAGVNKTVSISPNIFSNTAGRLIPFMARAFSENSSDIWSTDTISIITNQTLGLLINANKDPVAPGSTLSYDLSYGHQGGTATTNTELRFPLPSGTSFVSADGNGTLSGNDVIWNLGLVNPGEGGIHRVTVQLNGSVVTGDIITVENATITGDANFITEQARSRIATWVGSVPQLDFSMEINPNPVKPGEFLNAQLTVTNLTASLLTDVRVEINFPEGLNTLTINTLLDGGNCTILTDSSRCNNGETVFWDLGILPPGGGKTVSLVPSISPNTGGQVLHFMGRAFAVNTSDQWRNNSVLINTNQTFNIALDIDQEPVAQVTALQYNLTFGNRSDLAVSNTTLLFPIPEGASFVSADGDGIVIGNDVVWDVGTLNAGEGSRRQVNLQLNNNVVAGEILEVNKAIIQASQNEKSWATSKQRVKFDSVFNLGFTLNPNVAMQNDVISADITIDNLSNGTMTGVVLELSYPGYLFNLSDSSLFDGGDCTTVTDSSRCNGGETVLWNIGNIQTNTSRTVGMSPTIRSGTGEPADGTVIQFYAKAANAASDRAFVTRSLLVGNFVSAEQPEIDIQGNGQSIVSGDVTPSSIDSTDFGTHLIGVGVTNHTFVISNTGTAQLNLTGNPIVTITGNSDFSVSTQPASSVAIGATSNFIIAFNPTSIATVTATVSISNDDIDEDPYTFQIQGRGVDTDVLFMDGFEEPIIPMAPTLTLNANPTTINSGESTTLTWVVDNDALSCTKTGDWSGSANPANGQHSEVITNLTSTSTYSLQCTNGIGNSSLQQVTVIVNIVPPTLVIAANPTVVNSGASSNISWTLSNNAVSCTKSGAWSGVISGGDVTNGFHVQAVFDITTTSTFTLVCSNAGGTSQTQSVTVTVNTVAANCSVDQPPILGGAEDTTIKANGTLNGDSYNGNYDDISVGSGWPGDYGASIRLNLTKNQYMAAAFNSGSSNDQSRLSFIPPSNFEGPVSVSMTVVLSECPGDFSTHLNQPRCLIIGGGSPALFWSTDPNANSSQFCILEKNKDYYLNIVHSNSDINGFVTSGCSTSGCGILAVQQLLP